MRISPRPPMSLSYAQRGQMDAQELTNFAARGGQFRTRPGAPMADAGPNATTGMVRDPGVGMSTDASWRNFFPTPAPAAPAPSPVAAPAAPVMAGDAAPPPEAAGPAAFNAWAVAPLPGAGNAQDTYKQIIRAGTDYHAQNGLTLPAVNFTVANDILKKYQTPGTEANVTYGPRLAALNADTSLTAD